ncbi:alpha/beta hydrolase [Acrocarpospora macrocephala]|uniref:alpha/beta fold hydrolase n=1 Tax=Acrocarpospora macrocephala TaxID=150177 RepID=UPI0031D786A5
MTGRVVSRDGTSIAYDTVGGGPVVILVGGGLDDGAENAPLAAALAGRFTVVNYSRRGRGSSGDTLPYAPEREIEDLAALIAAAGGPAHLFGASSGGALALEAAAAGLPIGAIVLYEVPYIVGDGVPAWREYVARLTAVLAEGRRDEALRMFMRLAGSSEQDIAGAAASPLWPGLLELAHTLGYDAACLGDGPPPAARLATITRPVLVTTGAHAPPFFVEAADAVAACVPGAERGTVDVPGHVPDPAVLAPVLARFFLAA